MIVDLLPALLRGASTSIAIFAGAAAVAVVAAPLAAAGRTAPVAWVRWLSVAYVECFRGTSALVQLFWVYFVLPAFGLRLDAAAAAILVLGLNTGAYGAELVRGALAAVPAGQGDAAAALGLSRLQSLRLVVAPQALAVVMPPAGNLLIELLKATSLVSLIGIGDLAFQARALEAATLRSGELNLLLLALYAALAAVVTLGMGLLERRLCSWRQVAR